MRIAKFHRAVIWSGVAVMLWFLSAAAAVAEVRPCTCRYAGESYVEGRCVCITTSNGPQMACCGKVLNNTSWSFRGGTCPVALDRAPDQDPAKQIADFVLDDLEHDGTIARRPISPQPRQ